MFFSKKEKTPLPPPKEFVTVAIDPGCSTTSVDDDGNERIVADHIVTYSVCLETGERRVQSKCTIDRYNGTHRTVEKQKAKWLAGSNQVYLTDEAEVFNWDYFPAQGVDELMRRIRENPEMAKLMEDQPTVENAVDQLETVVKMCKNL